MAKFHFRLQPVLKHRERREQQMQRELATAQQRCLVERVRLNVLANSHSDCCEAMRTGMQEQTVDVEAMERLAQYELWLKGEMEAQSDRLWRAEQTAEQKRLETVQAAQETEMLERLRDRQLDEFTYQLARAEQAALDEAAVLRWKRA